MRNTTRQREWTGIYECESIRAKCFYLHGLAQFEAQFPPSHVYITQSYIQLVDPDRPLPLAADYPLPPKSFYSSCMNLIIQPPTIRVFFGTWVKKFCTYAISTCKKFIKLMLMQCPSSKNSFPNIKSLSSLAFTVLIIFSSWELLDWHRILLHGHFFCYTDTRREA